MKISPLDLILLPSELSFIFGGGRYKFLRFLGAFVVSCLWVPVILVFSLPVFIFMVYESFS